MKLNGIFKVSALLAAMALGACGGDINISEGDVDNSDNRVITNPPAGGGGTPTPGDEPFEPPTLPTTNFETIEGDGSTATEIALVEAARTLIGPNAQPVFLSGTLVPDPTVEQTSGVVSQDNETEQTFTLSKNLYILDEGSAFAIGNDRADSVTLEIEPGTIIAGASGDDFIVVRRDSRIVANGSASEPIIMTSLEDVTGEETGIGQWGGLVLLGNAPANSCGDQVGETTSEELTNCGVEAEGNAGLFGGTEEDDDSGILRYVRVSYAGNALSGGDELNGISFAGVGSDTLVEFIQVHQNLDDGIEFFGGTVDVKYVALTDIGDDSFDWSFGWTGSAQFVYIQQSADNGDNAFEADNSEFDSDATPLTDPFVSNVTILGAANRNGVRLRAGTAGTLSNFLITGPATYQNCLRVNSAESAALAASGDLSIQGSIVACAAANNFNDQAIGEGTTETWFTDVSTNSVLTAEQLNLDPTNGYEPLAGSPLLSGGVNPRELDSDFDVAAYVGAFDGQTDWLEGWTIGIRGGFPTDIDNAFDQGLATDVTGEFPDRANTNLPVYRISQDATFIEDVTLTNDAYWVLDGRTAVGNDNADSAVLYVEAGTTVFGEEGDDFLVVRRGSRIEARGTATQPITFTSVEDVTGQPTSIGQWGGLVLLGNAPANSCGDQVGETTAEELANCGVEAEGNAGLFGGEDEEDNSGTLRYVIVSHAGNALSGGDELNGISFAGVGSGTTVEFIQVHENLDDGIEFFGGAVSVRYVVLTDIGDDAFDWSFGWTGNAQFVYIRQSEAQADNAFESDNSEFDDDARPLTDPTVANVTIWGASGANGVRLRAGTAGSLYNFAITGPTGYSNCLRVNSDASIGFIDSGDLSISNSVVACETASNFSDGGEALFGAGMNNTVLEPAAINIGVDGRTPEASSPLLGAGLDVSTIDAFFLPTDYIGAFDGQTDWTDGWTVALNDGIPEDVTDAIVQNLVTNVSSDFPEITDKPVYEFGADTTLVEDVVLTNDAHWVLNGRTAVGGDNTDSAVLYIEPGTIIFGQEGDDFLVVRRGSQMHALGTATAPITFTSVEDVTGLPTSIGQWGGLVLLGNAPANSCGDQVGETTAEELATCGVEAEGDAGLFGGNDSLDDSGTLNYVIVKHAGNALSGGDELNGISFAGVGSGTSVEYIQVHENLDDGIEFFGGSVSVKYVVLTDIGDDAFDWSFGWTGNAQFVYIVQSDEQGDNAFESDNSEFDDDSRPLTDPTVANVTIVGADGANGVRLRAGTAGTLYNFAITGPAGYSNCLRVNSDASIGFIGTGDLAMSNSIVACETASNFSDGGEALFNADMSNTVLASTALEISDNGRTLGTNSPLLGAGFDASTLDAFFSPTNYIGAFDGDTDWTDGWVTVGLD